MGRTCWCGGVRSTPLSGTYALCNACGSVGYTKPYELEDYTTATPSAFYGDRYWADHVPRVLGLPSLEERARTDLTERAVYYLERVLRHVSPGSRVLEIGCAPGALAYLLAQAGMRVSGVELGPTAIEFVTRTFGIPVQPGPVERTPLEEPLDAVVAIDVLEHLPDPLATLRDCRERLADGGALILQTPCYRGEGADWKMLVPDEHLFLYTEESVRALLARVGFTPIHIDASLFSHDMWVVATRGSAPTARESALAGVNPLTATLITLYHRRNEANAKVTAAVRDRAAGESALATLGEELETIRTDQTHKADLITRISSELEAVRADQPIKEALIKRMSSELEAVRADQAAKEAVIARISQELTEVRADQQAKEELITRLTSRSTRSTATGGGD